MPKALLIIDYTNDFIADDGALTCKRPGQLLEDTLTKTATSYLENGDYVLFPTDTHQKDDPYHPETKLYPPHNIENTLGHELYGKVKTWYDENKDDKHVLQFSKDRYSSFQNTGLDSFLRTHKIDTLCLAGVCTDICVLHTAVSAYNLDYNIEILEQGVASFDETGHKWALAHFKNVLGAKLV